VKYELGFYIPEDDIRDNAPFGKRAVNADSSHSRCQTSIFTGTAVEWDLNI
jgi:hypothetical protein